jgi:glycine oxidase
LAHVLRAHEVYLVPRTGGRVLIGATVEEAGYDKRTDADAIQSMHRAAVGLVPALAQARVLESWAGLRPGTPDDLPILGATDMPGYFVAAGHFRDGILLAPVTAQVMTQIITGTKPELDVAPFSPTRFGDQKSS